MIHQEQVMTETYKAIVHDNEIRGIGSEPKAKRRQEVHDMVRQQQTRRASMAVGNAT